MEKIILQIFRKTKVGHGIKWMYVKNPWNFQKSLKDLISSSIVNSLLSPTRGEFRMKKESNFYSANLHIKNFTFHGFSNIELREVSKHTLLSQWKYELGWYKAEPKTGFLNFLVGDLFGNFRNKGNYRYYKLVWLLWMAQNTA